MSEGKHALLLRNKILNINLAADCANLCAARIGVLVADSDKLFLDDFELSGLAAENFEVIFDFFLQSCNFILNLVTLHICELSESHLHNCLCLNLVKTEALHQRCSCCGQILALSDNRDNLVDKVNRNLQAFQNMLSVLSFFEVILSTAADYILLELHIAAEHILKG